MSVISSWKKIKAMGVTSQLLVKALRTSEKLVSHCYLLFLCSHIAPTCATSFFCCRLSAKTARKCVGHSRSPSDTKKSCRSVVK